MNIIIPMAGMGKRLRPHTLNLPKPLIPIAGKPMVQHIVEDIAHLCTSKINEIHFVVGDISEEVKKQLISIAEQAGAVGKITTQQEPLGTAHAILCAPEALKGKVLVAFADTLFVSDDKFDESAEGVIFVSKVENWQQFGVVKVNEKNFITDFIEKPKTFVSDLAIIGLYYFKDGENLKNELQFLVDNNIREKGEYQLTNGMENMKKKGTKFLPGAVREWLDCGNKDATVYTNQRVLQLKHSKSTISSSVKKENAIIIDPCFIGENVVIRNSVVGPFVSAGDNAFIEDSVIKNSILLNEANISTANITDSMIGSYAHFTGSSRNLSMGDYSIEK